MSVLAAIVALCVVIILHELGHYLAAVWTGMKVDRFSVFGIGPAILKLGTWRGTEFVVSAIPFGAYVLIRGMEPEPGHGPAVVDGEDLDDLDDLDQDALAKARAASQAEQRSHNFRDKPLWARAAVLAGGPIANYLTAMILFFVVFIAAGVDGPVNRVEVTQLTDGQPAATAGMEVGDHIIAVGDTAIDPAEGTPGVVSVTKPFRGQTVDITVQRGDEQLVLPVTPNADEDEPALGAMLATGSDRREVGAGEAAGLAVTEPFRVTQVQLVGLYRLITGQLEAKVGGPVQIVAHIASSVKSGLITFLKTAALISTLLGMFNLLPLPALDGGRLTFLGYEALSRRKASPRIEELVHGYGMLALLLLIAVITVGDIKSLL